MDFSEVFGSQCRILKTSKGFFQKLLLIYTIEIYMSIVFF